MFFRHQLSFTSFDKKYFLLSSAGTHVTPGGYKPLTSCQGFSATRMIPHALEIPHAFVRVFRVIFRPVIGWWLDKALCLQAFGNLNRIIAFQGHNHCEETGTVPKALR